MFYTLLKFLGWGLLLAVIGGCIGWALRSLKCRGEVARARSSSVDLEEVDRMRHRVANLEQVVAERDRLRIQLADVRHADSPGIVGAEIPEAPEPEPEARATPAAEEVIDAPSDPGATPGGLVADLADEAGEATSIVPDADESGAAPADGSAAAAGFVEGVDDEDADDRADEPTGEQAVGAAELDLDAAAAELGRKVEPDDLTVVEGIGPKISELCSGIGITTWRQLADVDVADLQSMLDAAGSRYAVHKPATWPRQAELLATGRWAEFRTFTDELEGGK